MINVYKKQRKKKVRFLIFRIPHCDIFNKVTRTYLKTTPARVAADSSYPRVRLRPSAWSDTQDGQDRGRSSFEIGSSIVRIALEKNRFSLKITALRA